MRDPNPVLMKPREMKNAMTMSQIVEFENPDSPSDNDVTPVSTHRAMATMAMAPMGIGLMMSATMVATKMANMCHACASKPAGAGMNQMTTPTSAAAISLIQLTSFFGSPFFCLGPRCGGLLAKRLRFCHGPLLSPRVRSAFHHACHQREASTPPSGVCAFCLMEWGVINEGSEDGKRRGEGSANEAPDAR